MYEQFKPKLEQELQSIQEAGLFKRERIITSPQAAQITIAGGKQVLNFCANNYLGLSSHPRVVQAAKEAIDTHGFGMSSVRFICGTQDIHKELEKKLSEFTKDELFDKLNNYKKLLDNGLILQGEYDKLKNEILPFL